MSTRHHDRPSRRRATALAALLALGAPLLSHAAAKAQLDRTSTTPGEPLTLRITSDSATRGTPPDLAPLGADFRVLGTRTASNTSIVNGARSDQMRWDIRLQPKHTGRIEIPPIVVGADRTAALEVNVADASPAQRAEDGQHAFLEAEVNAASLSPYVQQQIPYRLRLFYDGDVTPTQLIGPAAANAVVEQLGPDKHTTATRQGREYNVIERDYAIAPEKSGALVISPPQFAGTEAVAVSDSSRDADNAEPQDDDLARMLANTPFANMPALRAFRSGSPFAPETRPITASAQQVTLDVKPRPADVRGDWLPAEQLSLQDDWAAGPPAFKVGEPVTRAITIRAKGLAASQIPSLPIASLANARAYPEAPENQSRTDGVSIYGISKQSVTYIPTQAGAMELPAIDLAWWDVHENVQRHATLPAIRLQVAPGVAGAQAGQMMPPVSTGALPAPQPHAVGTTERQAVSGSPSPKQIALWGIAGAFALAVLTWSLRRRRRGSPGPAGRTPESNAVPRRAAAMRTLQQACATHTAPRAAQALLEIARLDWPNDPPRGLAALAARVDGGRGEIMALDRCLYGGGESRWDGSALWQEVRSGWRSASAARKQPAPGLEPLYPRTAQ